MRTVEQVSDDIIKGLLLYKTYGDVEVRDKIREYIGEIIDDILSKPSMIYVEGGEAVYDYEKFGEYTKSL